MIDYAVLNQNRIDEVNKLRRKAQLLEELTLPEPRTITIDLSLLPEHQPLAPKGGGYYRQTLSDLGFAQELTERHGAIYCFHLPKNVTREQITEALIYCKLRTGRWVPSIKNIENRVPGALYTGSYKSSFCDRFIQHLGYGTPKTGSLQLIHWALPLFSEITMTYITIPFSKYAIHTQMEIALSNTVVPMIGRMERNVLND